MKRLDCESIESTYKSLEIILGVKESDLRQLFESAEVYKEMRESFSNFLFLYISDKTRCKADFDKACWFHATRTWRDNTYSDGLLPLNKSLDKISDFLFELTNGQIDIRQRIKSRNISTLAANKFSNPKIHGGPYGFLIREFAFVSNDLFSQYFESNEIVEDLAVKKLYHANTIPCIVKFVDQWTPEKNWTPTKALGTALLYAYHNHRGIKLDYGRELTFAFNGKGVPVPQENILNIEFPPENP